VKKAGRGARVGRLGRGRMSQAGSVMVNVRAQDLNEHLMCPLCNGYFRNAMSIRECLHTFCRSCLTKEIIYQGLKSCPTCKSHMGGNPLAGCIMDRTMQAVVDAIFPTLAQKEEEDRQAFYAERGIPKKAIKAKDDEMERAAREQAQEEEDHKDYEEVIKVLPQVGTIEGTPLPGLARPSLKIRMVMKAQKLKAFVYKRVIKLLEEGGGESFPIEKFAFNCRGTPVNLEQKIFSLKKQAWADQDGPFTLTYYLSP